MNKIIVNNLRRLEKSGFTFKTIYEVMSSAFSGEIFAEMLDGRTVSRTTYGELYTMTDDICARLSARYGAGDARSVGLYMSNSVQWVACFWGILKAGFTPLLLNTRQEPEVTDRIVEELGPACVISEEAGVSRSVTLAELMAGQAGECRRPWADGVILVTSGSTAFPKIVCHSGRSVCAQIMVTGKIVKENPTIIHNRKAEVKILAFLPFYHVFGLVATLMWFSFFGRTLVFLQDYNPKRIQDVCRREGVTNFFAIPLVWEKTVSSLLAEAEGQGRLESLWRLIRFSNSLQNAFPRLAPPLLRRTVLKKLRARLLGTELTFCISGGGFVSERTMEVLNGLGCSLYPGYGLTECGIVSVNLERRPKKRTGPCCGRIFDGIGYRLNEKSELEIYRDDCFTGIFRDGEFKANDSDYYCTNDRAVIEPSGQLRVLGRSDEIIITENGENVSPEAVEQRLEYGVFEEAAMMYMEYGGKKQLVLAVSGRKDGSVYDRALSLERLFASIDRLPLYERPARVVLVNGELPHTMKSVDRKRLAAQLSAGELGCAALEPPTKKEMERYQDGEYEETLKNVKRCFASVTGTPEEDVSDTSDFISDLGGDSMGYLELVSEISKTYAVEINLDESVMLMPIKFADYIIDAKRYIG